MTAHAFTHKRGGNDPIKLDDLAEPDDNIDLNANTNRHGLLPKLPGGSTDFLREDGTWATPSGSGGASTSDHFVTTQAEADLSNEANLGALSSGLLKHSVSGGVSTPATAVAGTDYVAPGSLTAAVVNTDESTSSTSYTDLSTAGPSVTITTTGTTAIVWIGVGTVYNTVASNTGFISVAVSGASTVAASDANSAVVVALGTTAPLTGARVVFLTGLTPGSNTFTLKYRVDGSTFHFDRRGIAVFAP